MRALGEGQALELALGVISSTISYSLSDADPSLILSGPVSSSTEQG